MRVAILPLLLGTLAFAQRPIAETRLCGTASGQPVFRAGYFPYHLQTGTDLAKIEVSSPDAVCNDGSKAIMYVRRAVAGAREPDGAVDNRWIIHLQGGGVCVDYDTCAERWCGTGFHDASKMSSRYAPATIAGRGIFWRDSANRLGQRNQVFVYYCSSDSWAGRKASAVLTDPDPPGGSYTLNFRGSRIVDGVLDDLERGVGGLPRLTEATDVLISGESGGATGVRHNIDRISQRLRSRNPGVRVRATLDATFELDQDSALLDTLSRQRYQQTFVSAYDALLDESCLTANRGREYLCTMGQHVERLHLTTPFFQRQDIADPKLFDTIDPNSGLTTATAAQAEWDQLDSLARTSPQKPGVIGSLCGQHVVTDHNDGFHGKWTRTGPTGTLYSYHDILWNWLTGATPAVLLAARPPANPANPVLDAACKNTAVPAPAPPALTNVLSANYAAAAAPEAIVAGFGASLASATAVTQELAWPTQLAGVQVNVTDSANRTRPAPVYFVSPAQVLYQVPAGTAAGSARVEVTGAGSAVSGPLEVLPVAPGLYTANQAGNGVASASWLRVAPNGNRTTGITFDPNTGQPVPIEIAPGETYLSLFGTGFRAGSSATASVSGITVPVTGFAAQGVYQGLDQINLGPLPRRLAGRGDADVAVRVDGVVANLVSIRIR